jgi:hypothetical protein
MKRIFLSLLFAAGFSGMLVAQKTINDAHAEKRNVGSFHGVEVATGIKLILSQGNTEEVAVSASTTEFRDNIVTKVENGILKIHYNYELKINRNKEKKELKAYVSYKNLDFLEANTGAEVEIEGVLKAPSLKMKANTGGVINGDINISELDVNQNTGSVITISGETGKLEVEGSTGSIFRGTDLKTPECNATASTGAGIYITVQKELNVKANTGGYIKYKGDAGIREIKTNTGGSVSKI